MATLPEGQDNPAGVTLPGTQPQTPVDPATLPVQFRYDPIRAIQQVLEVLAVQGPEAADSLAAWVRSRRQI